MAVDIIVIAGTTESRDVIEVLIKEKKSVMATVATDMGIEMLKEYPIPVLCGRLDEDGFENLIKEQQPKKVIDASHPFAKEVTGNVKSVCQKLNVTYERYERPALRYEYDQIHYVRDSKEAVNVLNTISGNVLLTTGVNTIQDYMSGVHDSSKRIYARVLNNEHSRTKCEEAGIDRDHLISEMPPFTKEDNKTLLEKHNCKVLVTKDSGQAGGVQEKVLAAKELSIPIIMIARPQRSIPRILLAGTGSGCGKTTITCGILKALKNKGKEVQPYKCGPDYIDPMLHTHIAGRPSINLDPFFMSESQLSGKLLEYHNDDTDLHLMEGVMGYYDGIGFESEHSSHSVARASDTPVILVVNAKGMAATLFAVLEGLIGHKPNNIRGVILNCCSSSYYQMIKPEIEKRVGIEVVGYFPKIEEGFIKDRHLGLMTAMELEHLDDIVAALGKTAEETIDLDRMLEIASLASGITKTERKRANHLNDEDSPRIAVAYDQAFCFYYHDNLKILEEMGAKLIFFSPIHDQELPGGISGLYLGGGYPEVYAKELSGNSSMIKSIRDTVQSKIPTIAECGGYMYLCDAIALVSGEEYPMAGIIPVRTKMTSKLNMQFGYIEMTSLKDNLIAEQGAVFRAHEFHYSKTDTEGNSFHMKKPSGKQWTGVYADETLYAGYPHLYFWSNRMIPERFMKKVKEI